MLQPLRDHASLDPARLACGTILVVGVGRSEQEAASLNGTAELEANGASASGFEEAERVVATLTEWIPVLRSRFVAQPLVLRLASIPERAVLELGRLAADLCVRGILVDGDDVEATLRRQLTDPEHLPGDFLAWLACAGVSLSDFARFVIQQIFLAARQHQDLHEILPPLRIGSMRTIRDRFRDEGLPALRKWRRLAEASYAALRLQRESGSLFAHAIELGYSEGPSLSHQVTSVFGATPGEIKATIGWEWWIDAWVRSRMARGDFPARH